MKIVWSFTTMMRLLVAVVGMCGCATMSGNLDSVSARRLAMSFADSEVLRQYGTTPAWAMEDDIGITNSEWRWSGFAGFGKGTLFVTVTFARDGSGEKVQVRLLLDELDR